MVTYLNEPTAVQYIAFIQPVFSSICIHLVFLLIRFLLYEVHFLERWLTTASQKSTAHSSFQENNLQTSPALKTLPDEEKQKEHVWALN